MSIDDISGSGGLGSSQPLSTFRPGIRVMFKNPQPDEVGIKFVVLEDRDDRVLVSPLLSEFKSWAIKPQSVYLKSDLIVAD